MPRKKLQPPKPDQRAAMLLTALRTGANDEDAALFAGVSHGELEAWLTDPSFSADVAKAKADLAVLAAGTVRRAVNGDVQVAQRVVDRQAGRLEVERLKKVSGVSR